MKKVFVGLSGGVDSAVAAYLLQQEGYEVTGAFIKGWEPDFLPCTGAEDRLSAMRVAAHLSIPFITVDLSAEYKKFVVDFFVNEYRVGRTPNPDVLCNRTIKFGAFWDKVKALGANYIATGHYAQTDGKRLLVSADPDKDQTYFLYTLTEKDLEHTLFPIGKYKKPEVRKIAEKIKLPNAARRDSQGLCFLGHVNMHDFLKRYVPTKTGEVRHVDGSVVGEHDGAWFYTLGQHVPAPLGMRLYVVAKDVSTNTLTVAPQLEENALKSIYPIHNLQWVSGLPSGPLAARYRYHGPLVGAMVNNDSVLLSEPILVAPGQSLVLYDPHDSICMGGAIIG